MAIILPHGVLFRGGAEERIRTKLLKDGHIDTVIGLPANLFYSTGIPVCILVLKKCKKPGRRAVHQRQPSTSRKANARTNCRTSTSTRSSTPTNRPASMSATPDAWGWSEIEERLQPEYLALHQHGRSGGRDRSFGHAR